MLQTAAASAAASQVISHRLALGAAALRDPASADMVEFTRMFTEKAVALFAATQIMMLRSGAMAQSMARYAMAEAMAHAEGSLSHTGWYERALSQYLALGALAMQAQSAALRPIYRAAGANARRLSRR